MCSIPWIFMDLDGLLDIIRIFYHTICHDFFMQHFILYQNTWNIGILYDEIFIWLVVSTPLKNMKVIWDDDIPKSYGKIFKSCSSHHQPVMDCRMFPVSGCFLGFRVPTSRATSRGPASLRPPDPCLSKGMWAWNQHLWNMAWICLEGIMYVAGIQH